VGESLGKMDQSTPAAEYAQATVTFIVGFIAIFLYKKQRRDEKQSAANIILLEIKTAEDLLKEAKDKINETRRDGMTKIPAHHFVMQTENWNRYKHLFVNEFTSEQFKKINKFYDECLLFDETVKFNDSIFFGDVTEIRKNVHKGVYELVTLKNTSTLSRWTSQLVELARS
jgi:cbb3-type cytochrome oxidase subunit 3